MKYSQIENTTKRFFEAAEIGVEGYAVEESGLVRIWNGDEWIGYYRVENDEMIKTDAIIEMLNAAEKFGITEG